MNPTTDTPRTDAEIFEIQDCNGQLRKVITIQFAKRLEQELNASQEAYLQSVERDDYLTQALAEAKADVERLGEELKKGSRVLATIVTSLETAVPWIRENLNRD